MVPSPSTTDEGNGEQATNYGVLLRLRILHESSKYPKNKGKGKGPAYFLGTVSRYRNVVKAVPPVKGRPAIMTIGCYQVRFDHGGLMQMHPDEVIAGINLFHEQVRDCS